MSRKLLVPIFVAAFLMAGGSTGSATAKVSPTVVKAKRHGGVKTVANLRTGGSYTTLGFGRVVRRLGTPSRIKRPYASVCKAVYGGSGLTLLFTSFGMASGCRDLYLQTATVWKRRWRVKVGRRSYWVGMRRSRTPARGRPIRGFGHQVASATFFGRRTGTVFLRFNHRNRISSILLWIGAAGD